MPRMDNDRKRLPRAQRLLRSGEFLTISAAGNVNDPTGASGSENSDVVIEPDTTFPNFDLCAS